MSAFTRIGEGDGPADAARCAGDQGNTVFQTLLGHEACEVRVAEAKPLADFSQQRELLL